MRLRGVAELFGCLGFSLADSKSSLAEELERLGRHAHWMLQRAVQSLAPLMTVLAGDEIFFRRDAIKVLMEPRSAAVLDVQRWPQRGSDEWQLMLAGFPALELFVSDDGGDLCSAAQKHGAGPGADFFHERRWFARVLGKLSAAEAELAKQLIELKKHGASSGPHDRERCMLIARTEIERRRAEDSFFAVMEAEEQLLALFMPRDPDDRLWDDDAIWRCLTAAIRTMDRLEGAAGERLREKIRKHVARRGTQCADHTLLWRTVPIGMRIDATWSRERVFSTLIERLAHEPAQQERPFARVHGLRARTRIARQDARRDEAPSDASSNHALDSLRKWPQREQRAQHPDEPLGRHRLRVARHPRGHGLRRIAMIREPDRLVT
jgi:hypothetical protein